MPILEKEILKFSASMTFPLRGLLLAPVVAIGVASAHANEIKTSSALRRFGDWEVSCAAPVNTRGDATAQQCKAVQRLVVPNTNDTAFALTVLRGDDGALVGIASVPLGGYLVPGIQFSIDDRKPFKLLVETCTSNGCHAGFPLTGRVEKEMKAGKEARFQVWSSKAASREVKVSLNGLQSAIAQLGQSAK